MGRGRKPEGPKLVERLDGSDEAKRRLRVILETVAGELTVEEACAELGIGKTAFFELRARVLRTALADLEPKPVGRPRKEVSEEAAEASRLLAENERLRTDLEIAHVREELALAMPGVFQPAKAKKKPLAGAIPSKRRRKRKKKER